MTLGADVEAWLGQQFGAVDVMEQRSAAVRLRTPDRVLWVKRYRSGRAWAQAERAFSVVVPALHRAAVSVPNVVAQHRAMRVRVLTEVPGRSMTLDDPPSTFAEAARVLRRLHRLPCAQESLPLGEAMRQRAATWATRPGAPAIARAIVDWVTRHQRSLDAQRVWCHRDYEPRNWILDNERVGLVDFEHTRPDHPLVDWVRLEAAGWSPEQRAAFANVLGEPDPVALRGTLAVYGLATWVWAQEHRDVELTGVGRRALRRAGFSP